MRENRRSFFKTVGVAVASASLLTSARGSARAASTPLTLGMASYTFRKFDLEQCLQMTQRLGLKRIAFKSFHLPLEASKEEIRDVVAKVNDADLELYGGGVIYMKNEEQVHQAFDYAKAAGMNIIIGVPNHELLELVEQKVKEYDIIVAIHNHGPGDEMYPSPESIYEKVKNLDSRIGMCMDIGHTKRINLDPSEEFIKYRDRVYDIHVKDVSAAKAEGQTVEIGRGVIDIPYFLSTLEKYNYTGTVSLEYEKDADDPLPGAAESIGYLRGVMATM